jgi:hypothetical protein
MLMELILSQSYEMCRSSIDFVGTDEIQTKFSLSFVCVLSSRDFVLFTLIVFEYIVGLIGSDCLRLINEQKINISTKVFFDKFTESKVLLTRVFSEERVDTVIAILCISYKSNLRFESVLDKTL